MIALYAFFDFYISSIGEIGYEVLLGRDAVHFGQNDSRSGLCRDETAHKRNFFQIWDDTCTGTKLETHLSCRVNGPLDGICFEQRLPCFVLFASLVVDLSNNFQLKLQL